MHKSQEVKQNANNLWMFCLVPFYCVDILFSSKKKKKRGEKLELVLFKG